MPHLSRYHTLHVAMREMRIWPPDAAKCCKNAGKFFPDEEDKKTGVNKILTISAISTKKISTIEKV